LKYTHEFVKTAVLQSCLLPLLALAGPMAAQDLSFERVKVAAGTRLSRSTWPISTETAGWILRW